MEVTYETITFIIGVGGAVFGVFMFFRKPQEDLEKKQAISEKENDGKNSLLSQRVEWERELSEKRFAEMGAKIDRGLTLAENHTHTVDVKVDNLKESLDTLNLNVTGQLSALTAIINERIPQKNHRD